MQKNMANKRAVICHHSLVCCVFCHPIVRGLVLREFPGDVYHQKKFRVFHMCMTKNFVYHHKAIIHI